MVDSIGETHKWILQVILWGLAGRQKEVRGLSRNFGSWERWTQKMGFKKRNSEKGVPSWKFS